MTKPVRLPPPLYPHFDLLEIGTPLIIEEGLGALQKLKAQFPDKLFLADLKIMDAGHLEARSGSLRGADVVTVLGAADDSTIRGAIDAAQECNGYLMADLIGLPDPAKRAQAPCDVMPVRICCSFALNQ